MTDDGLVDFAANYVSGEAACMVIAKHFSRFLSGKDLFKMRSCGIRCIARLSLTIGWTYSSGEHGLQPPENWDELVVLARRGPVSMQAFSADVFLKLLGAYVR